MKQNKGKQGLKFQDIDRKKLRTVFALVKSIDWKLELYKNKEIKKGNELISFHFKVDLGLNLKTYLYIFLPRTEKYFKKLVRLSKINL